MADAIFQFEIDRKRVSTWPRDGSTCDGSPIWKYERLFQAVMYDTLKNGGTFVLNVTPDKITAVQRSTPEDV